MAENPVPQPPQESLSLRDRIAKLLPQRLVERFRSRRQSPVQETPQEPELEPELKTKAPTRTFGQRLPEGARAKVVKENMLTKLEYGELTWTTGQTVRDILQNHLDANTRKSVDQMVASVLDSDRLHPEMVNEVWERQFEEFAYTLYRFKKGLGDFSPEAEAEMGRLIQQTSYGFPIKGELVDKDGSINVEAVKATLAPIAEQRPQILYKVVDTESEIKDKGRWVSVDGLISTFPDSRYQITAMQITDQGSGFDSTLAAFYKGTKRGRKYLRGRFGEGAKMSVVHLERNHAFVKMRSRYVMEGEEGPREVYWQARPGVNGDEVVKLKGVQIDLPRNPVNGFGSSTLIDIRRADPLFVKDFLTNIDSRVADGGIGANVLEYSGIKYFYPVAGSEENVRPVGVSLQRDWKFQYVQGLRVDSDFGYGHPIFSYDFLDSDIFTGRDRNGLTKEMENQIEGFWRRAESPVLLKELIRRTLLQQSDGRSSPEWDTLVGILTRYTSLNSQERRTQDNAFMVLPEVLGLREGVKTLVCPKPGTYDYIQEQAAVVANMRRSGWQVLEVDKDVPGYVLDTINRYFNGKFELFDLGQAKKEIEESTLKLDENDERVKRLKPLVERARNELEELVSAAGMNSLSETLSADTTFTQAFDAEKDQALELVFDQETKRFKLVVRPEVILNRLSNGLGMDYWLARFQVEMLKAVGRKEPYQYQRDALLYGQDMGNQLIEKTLRVGIADVDLLPRSFSYVLQKREEDGLKIFIEEIGDVEKMLEGWAAYERARNFYNSLEDLETCGQNLESLPEYYRNRVERILAKRVVVQDRFVGFYTQDQDNGLVFHKEKLEDLESRDLPNGQKVYRAEDKIFVLNSISPDQVIKFKKSGDLFVTFKGRLYAYHSRGLNSNFGVYRFDGGQDVDYGRLIRGYEHGGFVVDRGAYVFKSFTMDEVYGRDSAFANINRIQSIIDDIEVERVESGGLNVLKVLNQVVESPIPDDYGIEAWNNPVRIFQDIVQNHLDASPDGNLYLKYEVLKDGIRAWVEGADIAEADKIVGLSVADRGTGYLPDDIGVMGNTSKKSPIYRGKYGEGQKMLAAAAARNGFELTFSSLGIYEGQDYRWKAAVGTKIKEYVDADTGKRKESKQVVFNVSSELAVNAQPTSFTTLRLPEGASLDDEIWQEWVAAIDPRNKDERGSTGLGRYVIDLREKSPNVIDLGIGRVLLDEPGAVYENGLLISRKEKLTVGFDAPNITDGRDRNRFDHDRLQAFIEYALSESGDPKLVRIVIGQLKERYLTKNSESRINFYPRENDLNLGKSWRARDFVPNKAFWQLAYTLDTMGYFVFSKDSLWYSIANNREKLQGRNLSKKRREAVERDIDDATHALANSKHIPKEKLINVSSNEYHGWSKYLPTVEDYARALSEQRVDVDPAIVARLKTGTVSSARVIEQVFDDMIKDPDRKLTLEAVLQQKTPDQVPAQEALSSTHFAATRELAALTDQGSTFWQSPGSLYVAPSYVGFLGQAGARVGINEKLLAQSSTDQLVATMRHELLHKITGLADYQEEFIMLLLEMAKYNLKNGSITA